MSCTVYGSALEMTPEEINEILITTVVDIDVVDKPLNEGLQDLLKSNPHIPANLIN